MHSLRSPNLSLLSTKTLEQVHLPVGSCLSLVGTFFQVYRDWLARCLLGWYAGIHLDMVIWPQEPANPFKDIWILTEDQILAWYQLGDLSLGSQCLSCHFLLCSLS